MLSVKQCEMCKLRIPMDLNYMSPNKLQAIDDLVTQAAEAEQCAYRWCTKEARGSHSARTLAAVYASIYLDEAYLLRFADLRVLDDTRFEWAMTLIRGYVEGAISVPWDKVVALTALYDLYPPADYMNSNCD